MTEAKENESIATKQESLQGESSQLGEFILSCRRKPTKTYFRDLGLIHHYYLTPVFCFGISLIGVSLLCFPFLGTPELPFIFCILFLTAFVFLLWLAYVNPTKDLLHLHTLGIHCRMTFRPWVVRFDEIDEFRIGREISSTEHIMATIGSLKSSLARDAVALSQALSLTLKYKDGTVLVKKMFFAWWEEDDLETFVERIETDHPGLLVR